MKQTQDHDGDVRSAGSGIRIIQGGLVSSMNNMQLAGEKFVLGAGETLRMQGYVLYVRGRVGVAHGDGYLTTRRFVFCRKPRMPFGLGQFFKGRKIVFAFALEELQSIRQ